MASDTFIREKIRIERDPSLTDKQREQKIRNLTLARIWELRAEFRLKCQLEKSK